MSTTEEQLDALLDEIESLTGGQFYDFETREHAKSLLRQSTRRSEDIRIMGKSVEEIMVILRALEIERVTDIEVTMKNLDALYERLRDEIQETNQKAIQRAFAQLSTKDSTNKEEA